ncbi:DUF4954 family protein [Parabacteroides sp. PF5-6]|uniref:DUF4954 family protein n=1 Tax=Parabacteroides sp. PF5-6 TaxID=1742403 RepID=UPI0024067E8B|nr:DUF4954 family protein [Parabacteroides sp. PF5-6]MDF9829188.1 carbonic anhydrase/acetyltransferase-like protein (isoleucine patch superfamily) [Parabacteroides sp. PF5-6]
MKAERNLRLEEVAQLEIQGCLAEDWDCIFVAEAFTPAYIHQVHFSGTIRLGVFEKEFLLPGGVVKHSGIYRATLHNCAVGNNVLIENIRDYIANYDIASGARIQNTDLLLVEGISSFGNNVAVSVLNETGGREVMIYDHLSAPTAYIMALYRHRPALIEALHLLVHRYAERVTSSRGTIGRNVVIRNAGTIRNVRIGDCAVVENSTRLENGAINSNGKAPVYIGDSVIAQDFIVSSGATVSDAAKIIRCFIGQACHISHNFSAHDSLLFSNCSFENGEACAIFAGPFTVSMHKSSLLIAGMFSFLNAGSGSNQSNHMYKLGPIHQGIVERGSKTTSDSYILWPARIGAFSLVMGRHHHHSDTSDIPFSYLIEKGDETYLMPGVNLRSVGTIRDAQKWPKRDKREDDDLLDPINYNLLSPYTIGKMIRAKEILANLQKLAGETSDVYYYQNARIKYSSLCKGMKLYDMAIRKFLGNSLIQRLEGDVFADTDDLRKRLQITEPDGVGEWLDLSGLILPRKLLEQLLSEIEAGKHSLDAIEQRFREIHQRYYDLEWTWAYQAIEQYYGVDLSAVSFSQVIALVRDWQAAVVDLDHLLYEDARKEFSLTAMTGFGVDGTSDEKQKDFAGVRGDFENNPFVVAVTAHIRSKEALGNELIERLEATS